MNKAELIQYLKICQEKVDELSSAAIQYENAKEKLDALNQKPKLEKNDVGSFSFTAAFGTIWFGPMIVFSILEHLPFHTNPGSALNTFVIVLPFIIGIVGAVFAGRFWGKRKKEKRQAEVESKNKIALYNWENQKATNTRVLQQKMDRYRWEIQRIQKELAPYAAQCGLHPNYQNRMALDFIIEYLETGRSDTLKEALNLYELTMRELNRIDREYENQRRLEQITREGLADVQDELARNTEAVNRNTVSTDAAGLMGAMAYEELRHIRKNQSS